MGLWAATHYHITFTAFSFQAPASLTLWHHAYTLNALLTIQETADTFGLLCLGLLFVTAQLIMRNSMLSIFNLSHWSLEDRASSSQSLTLGSNRVKPLLYFVTASNYLTKVMTSPLFIFKNYLSSGKRN